jgi:signal transduction histidine kinase
MEDVAVEELDIETIVSDAQQRLMQQIDDKQAEIILPETWPVVVGYAPWIEEIWVNYLSNALKYGGSPPCIKLGATLDEAGASIRFWVQDNGPGLSQEEQASVFAQFTRLETTRAEGHGLGLSIVKRIVEKLGGQVGVESSPGQGSVFSFTLPLRAT